MKSSTLLAIMLLLTLTGCTTTYPPSSGEGSPLPVYSGISRHFKTATGDTNLKSGYKDHPELPDNKKGKMLFEFNAEDYLKGVKNDLKLVEEYSENAREKIKSVADAVSYGNSFFYMSHISPVHRPWYEKTNIKDLLGYPAFPDFEHNAPHPPIYNDEYSVWQYKYELSNFAATVDAYIEDGNHYIRNCANDHEMIRKKGIQFINYLQSLEEPTTTEY
jgi:hypothetical protein